MSDQRALLVGSVFSLALGMHAQVRDTTALRQLVRETDAIGALQGLHPYEEPGAMGVPFGRSTTVVRVDASGQYDSNALRNDLVSALWKGGEVSREVREASRDELKGDNRAGYDLHFALSVRYGESFLGSKRLRPVIGLGHRDVLGMRFTDAVYDLTFFGNAGYEGDAAIIAPTRVEEQRYQQLSFGFERIDRADHLHLALVNGQYLNAVRLDRGYLYTAPDGRYIDADLQGSWHTSDTAGQAMGRSNGLGLALSGGIELRSARFAFKLSAEDVGFIVWNSASQQLHQDGVIHYDGLYVDDIIDLDGTILGDAQLRDTLGLNTTAGSFTRFLPARFRAGVAPFQRGAKARRRPDLLVLEHVMVPGYLPHLVYTRSINLSRAWSGHASLGWGGFGGVRVGVGAWCEAPWGQLRMEVPNVIGMFSGAAKGRAIQVGLDIAF